MTRAQQCELMRGLLDYAEMCLERGRYHAAEEALVDADRLEAQMAHAFNDRHPSTEKRAIRRAA